MQYQCLDREVYTSLNTCPQVKSTSYVCNTIINSTIQYPNPAIGQYFQKQWCEPSTAQITCGVGQVINILCAYYGIDITYKCSGGFYTGAPDACYGNDSYTLVISSCQKKKTCSFNGNPSFESSSGFTNWYYFLIYI